MKTKTHVLGFTNVSDQEVVIFAKNKFVSNDELIDNITLIDRLLTIQKTHSLLNKKRGLKNQLSACIGEYIGLGKVDLNSRPKKSELI